MRGARFNEHIRYALNSPAPQLDWTDSAAYEFIDDLPNDCLAWEFLRRSRTYRKDFNNWFPKWLALQAENLPYRHEDWAPVHTEMQEICERWQLWYIYGPGIPTSSHPPGFKDFEVPRPPDLISISTETEDIELFKDWSRYAPSMTVRIHLDQPLNEQLAYLERLIPQLIETNGIPKPPRLSHPDSRRQRKGIYARYIQLLDARDAGVGASEISKTLAQYKSIKERDLDAAKDAAKKDLKKAIDYSEHDYMSLYRLPYRDGHGDGRLSIWKVPLPNFWPSRNE